MQNKIIRKCEKVIRRINKLTFAKRAEYKRPMKTAHPKKTCLPDKYQHLLQLKLYYDVINKLAKTSWDAIAKILLNRFYL